MKGEWDNVINSLKDANVSSQSLIELYEEVSRLTIIEYCYILIRNLDDF
jgi:hypothetical protein